jgi:hypothetical protein
MRPTARSAPVAAKRGAVNSTTRLKSSLYIRLKAYLTVLTHSWNLLVTAKIIRKAKNACGKSVYSNDLSTQVKLLCWIFRFWGDEIQMVFGTWAGSTSLRFTVADALLAARRIRILLMNQHAYRPITFGPLDGIELHGEQCGSLLMIYRL